MKIEEIPISDLKPAQYNPRKISDEELAKLTRGIKEFGIVQPILINKDSTIIGGHQRVKAAEAAGLKSVPCFRLDVSLDKEKALNIALNKISGQWDQMLLDDLLLGMDSVELTGFDSGELEKILSRNDELNLKNQIASEEEFNQAEDLAEKIVNQVKNHIEHISKTNPQDLNKALMVIINKGPGNNVIFLSDPNLRDVVSELKRYAEAGESSPLESFTRAAWK